ncbi:MAG TPA: hypothetical protein VL047_00700, partial [Albibacterium sp.]
IPNREVKPARADGTAVTGGRVGRRPILQEPCLNYETGFFAFRPFFGAHQCLLCIDLNLEEILELNV